MSTASDDSTFSLSSNSSPYHKFSFDEIKEATNNFDGKNILIREGFWTEYLGEIYDPNRVLTQKTRMAVAVRLYFNKKQSNDQFENEFRIVTKIQHPNLVSLLGYCKAKESESESDGEKILVYKYMENGRLNDYLSMDIATCLSWKQRLKICLDAAYGLQHLHKEFQESPKGIIHRDVKPSNIVLDENWVAKVSNFGLSFAKQIDSSTSTGTITIGEGGTPGYLAPEYISRSNRTTRKIDVYAFGVVLFQVLCRKMPWDREEESYDDDSENEDLGVWARENVDIEIKPDISYDSLKAFCHAIGRCLQSDTKRRPTMDRVVLLLETALKCQEGMSSEGEAILNIRVKAGPRILMGGGVTESSSSSSCREFSLDEIKEATNSFDEEKVLGHGGEGKVYLAEIYLESKTERSLVAVKRLDKNSTEFENEIQIVSKIQHPHLISLLGYCRESDEKILIYEYMGKGSLSDYINRDSTSVCLSWKQRVKICLGVAYGLQHLHEETIEFPKGIIHRDVKPENILLDEFWVAKVSDFGMFKLSNAGQIKSTIITDFVRGTRGYFAPEYLFSYQMTRKIDVYALGVVMFEVLCQKKPWDRGDVSCYLEQNELRIMLMFK